MEEVLVKMAANPGGRTMKAGAGVAEGKQAPAAASAERITVALIPKVAKDLQALQERTDFSKTDITNRAISLYEYIDAQMRAGNEIHIYDPETGQSKAVHFL
jgi:hypothetical protein